MTNNKVAKNFIWPLYAFIVLSSLVLLIVTSFHKWQDIKAQTSTELTNLHKLVSKSSNDVLNQQLVMLKIVGRRLQDYGLFEQQNITEELLDGFIQDNPAFIGYGLANVQGDIVAASHNIRTKTLPNLLKHPATRETFKRVLESRHVILGRSYYFEPLDKWLIPLRYAIRNEDGIPLAVITTGFGINGDYNPWKVAELPKGTSLTVIKGMSEDGDYYVQYRQPLGDMAERQQLFNNPVPKKVAQTTLKQLQETSPGALKALHQGDTIIRFYSDTPVVDTEESIKRFDTVSYNPHLDLYTLIRRDFSLMTAQWHDVLHNYFVAFILFNGVLAFLFRYIQRLQKKSRVELEYQATHDPLTDLPNRYHLMHNFKRWSEAHNSTFSLLFVDLNSFKIINDHYGHSVGDKVLVIVAQRLKNFCGQDCLLIRHGGDEFLIITPIAKEDDVKLFISNLLEDIHQPIAVDTLEFSIGASVGIASSPIDGTSLDELSSKADLAMGEAKKMRGDYAMFSQQMQESNAERLLLEKELSAALINQDLFMVYQPQVNAADGSLFGIEALLRWKSPTLGFVPPDKFIAVAEATGLIHQLGNYVIETVFTDIASLKSSLPLRVSINVSVLQLINEHFRETLNELAQRHQIRRDNVVIEVTESLFIEDLESIQSLLKQLQEDGYGISLDDFGTGYSSLSLLSKLPINEVKIDKSFVQSMLSDEYDKALIQSILSIGKSLQIPTLAEGVEDIAHARLLQSFGCDRFQGYYFARPMPKADLVAFLQDYKAAPLESHS